MTRLNSINTKKKKRGMLSIPLGVVGLGIYVRIAGIIVPRTIAAVCCMNKTWSRVNGLD